MVVINKNYTRTPIFLLWFVDKNDNPSIGLRVTEDITTDNGSSVRLKHCFSYFGLFNLLLTQILDSNDPIR